MVDMLAITDQPLGAGRSVEVAVLFADICGFTGYAETHAPEEAPALLRAMHRRLVQQVFAHGGTLDQYLGDGIMATFGTPEPAADDADRALACARRIVTRGATWNAARQERSEPALRISVGVHFGPVTLGDTGDANRMEYAVTGDTVNVASRVESLIRDLGCSLVVSDALLARVSSPDLCDGLIRHDPQHLLGRNDPIDVWTLD